MNRGMFSTLSYHLMTTKRSIVGDSVGENCLKSAKLAKRGFELDRDVFSIFARNRDFLNYVYFLSLLLILRMRRSCNNDIHNILSIIQVQNAKKDPILGRIKIIRRLIARLRPHSTGKRERYRQVVYKHCGLRADFQLFGAAFIRWRLVCSVL